MKAAHRLPPALRIDIAAQPRLQALVAALALLAALSAVLALMAHIPSAWPLLALLPLVVLHAWRSARLRPQRLRWDGEKWWLSVDVAGAPELAVRLGLALDLDRWMLLRLQPEDQAGLPRTLYLPVSAALLGAQWPPLRATLVSARRA